MMKLGMIFCKKPMKRYVFAVIYVITSGFILPGNSTQAQNEVNQPIAVLNLDTQIHETHWNPTGLSLAIASDNGVQIFDSDFQLIAHLYPSIMVRSISWNTDGKMLALTVGQKIEIWHWDGTHLSLAHTLSGNQTHLKVKWSPTEDYLLSVDGVEINGTDWAATIRFWDTTTWQNLVNAEGIYAIPTDITYTDQIHWNPDDTSEVIFIGDTIFQEGSRFFYETVRQINFIDVNSGDRKQVQSTGVTTTTGAWQPQHKRIILGGEYSPLAFDISKEEFILLDIDVNAVALDWTTDGRYLAANNIVYDDLKKEIVGSFTRPEGGFRALDWHPNNTYLVTAYSSGILHVEDASLFPNFIVSNSLSES